MLRAPMLFRQVLLFAAILFAGVAQAHEIRPALAEVSFPTGEARAEIVFIINAEALIAEIGLEHDDTDESANAAIYNQLRAEDSVGLRAAFDAFAPDFLAGLNIRADGEALSPEVRALLVPAIGDTDLPRDSILTVNADLPPGVENITISWDARFGSVVVRTELTEAGEGYSAFLQNGEATDPIPVAGLITQSALSVLINYIGVGFEHIVPLGLDHILFVIGLFLFSTQMRPLVIQISAFTVAHTVTLALGLFGVIRIAPEIVEPLIALSIAYVAIENVLFRQMTPWRPALVFAFGLLHGLGFAGVLAEFGLPEGQYVPGLIGFNIGVELGQLFVVLVSFLLVGLWFGAKDWYRMRIVFPASIAIGAYSIAWFIERSTEVSLPIVYVTLLALVLATALIIIVHRRSEPPMKSVEMVYVIAVTLVLTNVLRVLEGLIP